MTTRDEQEAAAQAVQPDQLMVCEEHPWLDWPDGDPDCDGPGMMLSDTKPAQWFVHANIALAAANKRLEAVIDTVAPIVEEARSVHSWCTEAGCNLTEALRKYDELAATLKGVPDVP